MPRLLIVRAVRLLLDTHVALLAIADGVALVPEARRRIEAPENSIFVSVVSVWEIAIKHGPQRSNMPLSGADAFKYFQQSGYQLLTDMGNTPPRSRTCRQFTLIPLIGYWSPRRFWSRCGWLHMTGPSRVTATASCTCRTLSEVYRAHALADRLVDAVENEHVKVLFAGDNVFRLRSADPEPKLLMADALDSLGEQTLNNPVRNYSFSYANRLRREASED